MAAQSKPAAAGRKQMRALAVASGGFYLTFAAWGLMENLISTYYQRLGYYSMSLVYFGIGPGALVAPAVIAKYGARRSMALACSTYTLYAIAHNLMEFGIGTAGQLLLPAGALVGFTCSTLWTSLGIYTKNLSRAYDVELGKDSETDGSLGFFNGITDRAAPQMGGLTALTGSTVLLALTGSRKLLYSLVTASLLAGNLLFLALPKHGDTDPAHAEKAKKDPDSTAKAKEVPSSFMQSLLAVPKLLAKSSAARKISLCYLSIGFSQSYTTGTFTADAVAREISPAFVGAVMAMNNSAEVIAALAFGRLSDKLGRFPCYLGALLIELINPLFFCLFPVLPGGNRKALMIFLSACLGIGSGGCTCCLRSLVGDLFDTEEETSTAMSTTFFVLSFTAGSGFYLGPNFGLRTKAGLYVVLLVISLFGSSSAVSSIKKKPAAPALEQASS